MQKSQLFGKYQAESNYRPKTSSNPRNTPPWVYHRMKVLPFIFMLNMIKIPNRSFKKNCIAYQERKYKTPFNLHEGQQIIYNIRQLTIKY